MGETNKAAVTTLTLTPAVEIFLKLDGGKAANFCGRKNSPTEHLKPIAHENHAD